MKLSQSFFKSLRETPLSAEGKGYGYLLRGCFVKQLGTGIFTLMPFGLKVQRKIEKILREEIDSIGGQEVLMPVVHPADIWKKTGRYYSIGSEMTRFCDRQNRDMVLAMTHEEISTDLAKYAIDSHKKLPQLIYQIQTKWRDDPRPRAGLIRVREFTMKDSYSFDKDIKGLEKQYKAHYDAYFRIFKRVGLPVIAVGSDSGMMGGKIAHEYMYLSPLGEDTLIICPHCGYTANRQVAQFFKGEESRESEKPLKEISTPNAKTINELCSLLKIKPENTAKAVMMWGECLKSDGQTTEGKLVLGIVRGDLEVEENKLQNAAKMLSLRPATEEEIRKGGLVPGFASSIGAKKDVVVIIDESVKISKNLVAGANKEGFHYLNTNYNRDYKGTVCDIAQAYSGALCPHCKKKMEASRGIEVGNIFQLGTRYSDSIGLTYQDEKGERKSVVMGSYGIGVGRTLACIAENYSDDNGIAWPITVAPFEVEVVNLTKDSNEPLKVYKTLLKAGIDVLYDDRDENAGVKFADSELIGAPIRISIGNRTLKEGKAEIALRSNLKDVRLVPIKDIKKEVKVMIEELKSKFEVN